MSLLVRCEKCKNYLDAEDLFCTNCGHEAPAREGERHRATGTMETFRFDCEGCGATLTWSIESQALHCTFCGNDSLKKQEKKATVPRPHQILVFGIEQQEAAEIFRDWVGRGFFRPSDVRQASSVTEMRGIYLPYYAFRADCDTYWTADSNATPMWARASWAPYSGHHEGSYAGVIIPASGALTLGEIRAIEPFDMSDARDYDPDHLGGKPSEAFSVTKKRARHLARKTFEDLEKEACAPLIPGSNYRNLHVNVLITGMGSIPVLLPVWIMAYEYNGKTYRFLVNGQTGKGTGTAPISIWRVLLVVIGVLAAIGIIFLIITNI